MSDPVREEALTHSTNPPTSLAITYDFCHNTPWQRKLGSHRSCFPEGPAKKMNNEEYLAQITIPVPCPQEWRRMRGDRRTRHCDLCGKNVHNLAAMTADEVVELIKKNDGELCGLVTRQSDGTLLTSDRRPRLSRLSSPWQFKIRDMMTLIACVAPIFGMMSFILNSPIVVLGGVRMRPAPPGTAAQCSDADPDEELESDGCLDKPISNEPNLSPPAAHP
jgi:hypothetical protein